MTTGSIFLNNKTQAVRLPADRRFPDDVKQVRIIKQGHSRLLTPIDNTWDDFFLSDNAVSSDFLPKRATQLQTERESLDDKA